MSSRDRRARQIQRSISAVLATDWDPIGVDGLPKDEYDSCVGAIYRLLVSGASVHEIAAHLVRVEEKYMGLGGARVEARLAVAEKLKALDVRLDFADSLPAPASDRAPEDPTIIGRIAEILAKQWDPAADVRAGLEGDSEFYREQAVIVAGMLAADAQETEVQRYLRQLEQQALPATLHPADARQAIARAIWQVARNDR